ncbi:MAG: GNAT family N-acetyltransferase [Halanaerobiaceae bacterium]
MSFPIKKENFQIRFANKGDADEIYYLVQRAFSSYGEKGLNPASKETIDDICDDINNNVVLIIEWQGYIVGSLRLVQDKEKSYFLKRFSIHPDYQHQGLGTMLYFYTEEKVREMNGKYIWLYSSTEDIKLIDFYDKLGFECIDRDWINGYERGLWIKKIDGVD